MSLQNLANHMQSAGRGDDSMLVHMTPKEVGGLQALAMAHGGSLTINPETGLPEAGFLSSLLPTLIGAGLTVASGGALSPLMAAGLTGAGYGLYTGNLGKGLMAGLGAYGGAGLGAGLSAAGTGATFVDDAVMAGGNAAGAQAAGQATANQVIAKQALEEAAKAPFSTAGQGLKALASEGGRSAFMSGMSNAAPYSGLASGASLLGALTPENTRLGGGSQKSLIRPYTFERTQNPEAYAPSPTAYSGQPFRSSEQNYFNDRFTALDPYSAPGPEYKAAGGLTALAVGGPVETMSAMNAVGENLGYPQSQFQTDIYSNPNVQRPEAMNMIAPSGDVAVDAYTGEQKFGAGGLSIKSAATPKTTGGYEYSYDPKTQQFTQLSAPTPAKSSSSGFFGSGIMDALGQIQQTVQTPETPAKPFTPVVTGGIAAPAMQPVAQPTQIAPVALPAYQTPEQQLGLEGFYDYMNQQLAGMRKSQGMAAGGISHLGDYSDGGRLLKGPGDGVSDSIPASIGNRQPARLADGEFVIPARIVSELGNGSTEAGARKLYAMMDRVQNARKKSVGKKKVAVDSKAEKLLPA
jgi:hypothetical protein